MEFGIEKYAIRIIESGKRESEGIELSNQECIRTLGETENDKYLGVLEADTIKQLLMKEKKKRKACLRSYPEIIT